VLQKPLLTLLWRDVVVLLCGDSFLSAEMLFSNFVFADFPTDSLVPTLFRTVCEELCSDDLRLLLYFATEQPAIPFGGLNNPRGHAPVDKITVRCDKRARKDALPTSSVCFYLINLPQYDDLAVMKDKVLMAIRETGVSFDRM
jgi:hypothetical protein